YVEIDKALFTLEEPDKPALDEILAEGLIVRHFTSGAINAEEFHWYSARLLDVSRRRKEIQ
ncbi:hypothetical protein, partial [Pseudomonas carnis]